MLHKKMSPQNSYRASSVKKYLEDKPIEKKRNNDEDDNDNNQRREKTDDGCKWVKTDSECKLFQTLDIYFNIY